MVRVILWLCVSSNWKMNCALHLYVNRNNVYNDFNELNHVCDSGMGGFFVYINRLRYDNVGPMKEIDLSPSFQDTGSPHPMIFVGENGSGKSLLLSNIVDAFFEIARQEYTNATIPNDTGGYNYFKTMAGNQISTNQPYLCSYISFKQNDDNKVEYVFKCGNLQFDSYKENINLEISNDLKWTPKASFKNVTATKEVSQKLFSNNVLCYFAPDRYEKPAWMGLGYNSLAVKEHLSVKESINGHLDTPIIASNITEANLQWLLDIIVDSRPDVEHTSTGMQISHVSQNDLRLLSTARKNVELILSDILGKPVYLSLNFRSEKSSRFNIRLKGSNQLLVPTLDSLSTGQLALFNLFVTIIRYADNNDINKSINISDITGIVVIDEVELHLHSHLQKTVLPALLSRFPKIQFVLSSHSPLFLLGMEEVYGTNNIDIFQLPDGIKITAESFSEFLNAYEFMSRTQKHHTEIRNAINSRREKALLITEGASDWKHIKAAFNALKNREDLADLFSGLDFDFLEYEPKNSEIASSLKLEMGCSALCSMCETYSKIPQPRIIIFLADNDDAKTTRTLSIEGAPHYKAWGNSIYSFVLPVPSLRSNTPEICIEHLYSDNEIQTEVEIEGIARRLFLGHEFDAHGKAPAIDRFCLNRNACGENKISIIEGSEKDRVVPLTAADAGLNYALPKMIFASKVLEAQAPFDSFGFDSFIPIFRMIKEILAESRASESE